MTALSLLFWLLFIAVAASGFATVLARNLLYAALGLALTLLGTAGLFLLLHADFLAAVQVLVYVGGITVLILFALVLSADVLKKRDAPDRVNLFLGAVTAAGTFFFLAREAVRVAQRLPAAVGGFQPTTAHLGELLLGKYVLPFEIASVVLVVTMVGAVMILRKELEG
ncbi:MAG: NADH-quinone oxidoreductase subunit J [Planctomycetota bacterium]